MSPASRPRYRARWAPVAAVAFLVVAGIVIVLSAGSSPSIGYDISYPQCSGAYPSNPLFAVVGVNGGRASTANPCLGEELQWARGAAGQKQPHQPSLSLYIDTGNPGVHVAGWPTGGSSPRYGSCNGLLTNSCSYIYSERRAVNAYRLAASVDQLAARTVPWWLDVELTLSWAGTYELNIAALRGFIAGLRSAGATGPIGIYSTEVQWREITGLTTRTTRTAFGGELPDWVAGTGTTAQARQECTGGGFTGVAPILAQYRAGAFDADLRCPGSP